MSQIDAVMPCLCCDRRVGINREAYTRLEAPVVLCQSCAKTVPDAVLRVLFLLRSQVTYLTAEVAAMKMDIKKLYSAQRDIEQDYLARG